MMNSVNEVTVIGVDCATDSSRVGLALGKWRNGRRLVIEDVRSGADPDPVTIIGEWLQATRKPTLIAIDAPLGWPAPLADGLRDHRAGSKLNGKPNDLFRRETDREIQRRIGITPLDVGADRIARTAHAALELLAKVCESTSRAIPLAWSHHEPEGTSAIEVYPAATLRASGLPYRGYKKVDQEPARRQILASLSPALSFGAGRPRIESAAAENADLLDAIVCLVAAKDFLESRASPPGDLSTARREGWIWVRDPGVQTTP
jgi:predicted nuclease with RNAse H fold